MKFFVPVHTVEGTPWDTALVEVTDEDLDVILKVSKVVNECNHSSVSRVDSLDCFTWSKLHGIDIDMPEEAGVWWSIPLSLDDLGEDDHPSISSAEIVITKDSVWWEFYVKHVDQRFDTKPITLEYLVTQLAKEPV